MSLRANNNLLAFVEGIARSSSCHPASRTARHANACLVLVLTATALMKFEIVAQGITATAIFIDKCEHVSLLASKLSTCKANKLFRSQFGTVTM
jgi:hypothetical protein